MTTTAPPAETTAPPAYDWDALLPAAEAPAKISVVSAKVDVIAEIPATIRGRAEDSLRKFVAAKAAYVAAGNKIDNFRPTWEAQPVADVAMGEALRKLFARYAKYRPDTFEGHDATTPTGQITIRTGQPGPCKVRNADGSITELPMAVRYSARPLEGSNRLPGTAGTNPPAAS